MAGDLLAEVTAASELEELRRANTQLERRLKKRADAREELREEFYRAVRDAALIVGAPTYVQPPRDKRRVAPEAALLHLTDLQVGKQTPTYDMDTARRRVLRAVHKTVELTELHRTLRPIPEIRVLFGGDMVEGVTIFPGQAWEIEAGAYEQVMFTAALLRDVLVTLAHHFERVQVHWVSGNHGRIARRGDHPRGDNLDRFVYGITQIYEQPPNVTWHDTTGFYTHVRVGRYVALLVHGDQVGAAPVTIQNKVVKWQAGVLEPFRDCYLGHQHHVKVLELPAGGRIFMTSSPESGNAFAAERVGSAGTPTQRLNFVSPTKGRVTAEYLLEVE